MQATSDRPAPASPVSSGRTSGATAPSPVAPFDAGAPREKSVAPSSVTPAGASPAPATPTAPVSDAPADLWNAVLGAVQAKPSMGWVKGLSLSSYNAGVARVKPVERGIDRMMSPQRCEQIGNLMATLLGRPVRVEVDAPAAPPSQGPYGNAGNTGAASASPPQRGASAPGSPGAPTRPANTPPARPANAPPRPPMPPRSNTQGQPNTAPPVNPATNRAAQFQQAMGLPLVKEVMELFDATIIDVRPERKSGNAANAGADDTADTTAGDDSAALPMESPEPPMIDDDEQG